MGRYFDYSDWKIEEITNSIRERIHDSKQPIPKKIIKHFIQIRYKIGDGCYSWSSNNWMWEHDEFTNREEAITFLNKKSWIERTGENMWVDCCNNQTYTDKEGNVIPYHYEIEEYDSEIYEDGEYHTEYTDKEKNALSEALLCIEKARIYLKAFDRAENNASFGSDSFCEYLKEEFEDFFEHFTEELPEDYYNNEE